MLCFQSLLGQNLRTLNEKTRLMNLEDVLNVKNKNAFYREFTYSRSKFKTDECSERELADALISISDTVIGFQIKERNVNEAQASDKKWFSQKVLGKAVGQLADTQRFLAEKAPIHVTNNTGIKLTLPEGADFRFFGIVCYEGIKHDPLLKLYLSRRAGPVHIFKYNDYTLASELLFTFWEITEYLLFRESILKNYSAANGNSEKSLIGQYISGHLSAPPSEEFGEYAERLIVTNHERKFRHVLWLIRDRLDNADFSIEYYNCLREFALLTRNELREIGQRFDLMCKRALENEVGLASRMATVRRDCCFMLTSFDREMADKRKIHLASLTGLAKYSLKTSKGIGVSVVWDGDSFLIDWAFAESPYSHNRDYEHLLEKHNPFAPIRKQAMPRYEFE